MFLHAKLSNLGMPKTTIKDACRKRGLTYDQWAEAKRQGVDPWIVDDMDKWLKTRRHRIAKNVKISSLPPASTQTLAEMENAIRAADNIDDVRILKEKVLALKGIIKVQIESKELVYAGEVRESAAACFSILRAELLKLTSDLPPQLAGLSETKVQKVLRENIIELLLNLSDSKNKLFDE